MPPFLISLLSKLGPYAAVALVAMGIGAWGARRFDLGTINGLKLAVAQQQAADAQATADWNAKAATFEQQLAAEQNTAQAERQAAQQADAVAGAAQETALAKQAAQPGQDAPVAPVLASEHDNLAQAISGGSP